MNTVPNLTPVTLLMTRLAARYRWLHAPAGLLLVLLQRTPVIRLAAMAETAATTGAGEGMKYLFTVAALGAYNSLAGATTFSVSPASPASGPARSTFTVSGTVGAPLTITYTVTGAPGNPKSWSVSGALPAGLAVDGGNPVNVVAPYKMTISGTPATAGTVSVSVTAWDTAGAKGNNGSITTVFNITGGVTATAPAITAQPSALTVTAGSNATFSVTATGSPAPGYQWQKGGANIAGATAASYTIASAQGGDAGSYAVVVSNSAGSVTSNSASLTVNSASAAPVFTTQPAGTTVTAGSAVTLTAIASGSPAPSYQWQKGGVNLPGATSTSFTVANAQPSDTGTYTAVATNSAGSVTSNPAGLTVNAAVSAPAITAQPQSLAVIPGAGVTFTVSATGSPAPGYQWKKGGANIAGATGVTYTIASAQAGDAGSYTVVVSNSAGSVTSNPANLTVSSVVVAPAITAQPQNQAVAPGASVTLTVAASGTAPFTYQWRRDGMDIAGATGASFTIASFQSADVGSYSVTVANGAGQAVSANAALTVNAAASPPVISANPLSQAVATGRSVSFAVAASGATSYQWQESVDGGRTWSSLGNNATYSGVTTAQLTITGAGAGLDGNLYRAALSGGGGTVTTTPVILSVVPPVLPGPVSVGYDRSGRLLAIDGSSNVIVTVAPSGQVTELAGLAGSQGADDGTGSGARFRNPGGLAVNAAGDACYLSDTGNSLIRMITASGQVTTLAGSRDNQGYRDGTGPAAWFNSPADLAVDRNGNIFVADTGNSVIRRIAPDGTVTTFAGASGQRGSADGTGGTARFNQPGGIAIDASGMVYVADTFNHTIRRITPAGAVSTFAGVPGISGTDDGIGGLLNQPGGLALDYSGNLYVADTGNNTIRVILPSGQIRTVAGLPTVAGLEDGSGLNALFNQPKDVCIDGAGIIWVADYGNATIRRVSAAGAVSTPVLSAASAPPAVPVTPPVTTPTTPTTPTAGGSPASSSAAPPEVGVGGGGGAVSHWFLLSLGLLAALRCYGRRTPVLTRTT